MFNNICIEKEENGEGAERAEGGEKKAESRKQKAESDNDDSYALTVLHSSGLENITLIPNPTTGELRITSGQVDEWTSGQINSNKGIYPLAVEIFDVYGRNIGAKFPSNSLEGWQSQADGVVFNISHLSAGIYFVKITTEQGEIVKKVIKQ